VSTLKRQEKIKKKMIYGTAKAEGQQRMGIWDKQTWRRPYRLKLVVKLALITQYDLTGEVNNRINVK
jgi:hypothetical protein